MESTPRDSPQGGSTDVTMEQFWHIMGSGSGPHLLKSLPVLVSQPLVLSRGKHVSWALPQKHVLLV